MPIGEIYEDFALAHFGKAVAAEAGKILAAVDGAARVPIPATGSAVPAISRPTARHWRK